MPKRIEGGIVFPSTSMAVPPVARSQHSRLVLGRSLSARSSSLEFEDWTKKRLDRSRKENAKGTVWQSASPTVVKRRLVRRELLI